MEKVDCFSCDGPCHYKKDGKLVPKDCYMASFLKRTYADLLTGSAPSKEMIKVTTTSRIKKNSMIYYPFKEGRLKSAALILMNMKVTSYKTFHTHYLIDVFVSKSDDDQNFSSMYSPFFLLLHGFVPTPNIRLMDLIREFLDYRLLDKIPFLLFSVTHPDQALQQYFKERDLSYTSIMTDSCKERELF